MSVVSNIRELIKMGDFFNSNQMLRFQHQTEYRTFTGGLISIGIILTIIAAFASMIINTVNRTIISFTHNEQRDSVPSLTQITASPDNNFMFAVQVQGYNLSSDYRYFDVLFEQIQSSYGSSYVHTPYTLEPCTKAHWAMLPSVVESFQKIKASNWLCPTIGTVIKLQGKFSSQNYNQFSVTLYSCSNSTDPTRPCAPQQEIQAYVASNGQWNYFNFYYVNSIINADQPQYKSYYLQDRNYIPFSSSLGAELDMYLTQIKITSDNSIWPFEDNSEDSVLYIPFGPILYAIPVDKTSSYATFYVMKDYANEFYIRQVQKIFVVFSFMGGLIGAIMASLFIINTYTSFAYELALALQVFTVSQEGPTEKKMIHSKNFSFSIVHFLKYVGLSLLNKLRVRFKSPFYEHVNECREEIIEQLDIRNLIKRIIFIEYSLSFILEDYQLAEMNQEKPTLPSEVKKLRKKILSQALTNQEELQSNSNQQSYGKIQRSQASNIGSKIEISKIKKHSIILAPSKVVLNLQDQLKEPQTPNSANSVVIYDQRCFSRQRKQDNLLKLEESAKEGNMVSRKLLQVINYQKESCVSDISEKNKQEI